MFVPIRITLSSLLLFASSALAVLYGQQPCTSCKPNPISVQYRANTTGTINGTVSVLLVDLAYARSIIPSRYPILNNAYTRFGIPSTSYPIILETGIDHDIQLYNRNLVQDFSSLRLTFPFVDLLHDGSSNFRYSPHIALPYDDPLVIAAAEGYGENVSPATFTPRDAGWAVTFVGRIYFEVFIGRYRQLLQHEPQLSLFMEPKDTIAPYSLQFYKNVTNQPTFSGNGLCDNMVRLWNSSVSEGQYAPRAMTGTVKLNRPFVPEARWFEGVHGVRGDTAFVENNYLPCGQLRGYGGRGEGDSG